MADTGGQDMNQEPDTGDKNQTPILEEDKDDTQNQDLTNEMYLPDLDNTPLSQALKTGLDLGMEDKGYGRVPKAKAILLSGHFPCSKNIWMNPHIHP